jgi:hypothetical protein
MLFLSRGRCPRRIMSTHTALMGSERRITPRS